MFLFHRFLKVFIVGGEHIYILVHSTWNLSLRLYRYVTRPNWYIHDEKMKQDKSIHFHYWGFSYSLYSETLTNILSSESKNVTWFSYSQLPKRRGAKRTEVLWRKRESTCFQTEINMVTLYNDQSLTLKVMVFCHPKIINIVFWVLSNACIFVQFACMSDMRGSKLINEVEIKIYMYNENHYRHLYLHV